jgi:hypothetical protein
MPRSKIRTNVNRHSWDGAWRPETLSEAGEHFMIPPATVSNIWKRREKILELRGSGRKRASPASKPKRKKKGAASTSNEDNNDNNEDEIENNEDNDHTNSDTEIDPEGVLETDLDPIADSHTTGDQQRNQQHTQRCNSLKSDNSRTRGGNPDSTLLHPQSRERSARPPAS